MLLHALTPKFSLSLFHDPRDATEVDGEWTVHSHRKWSGMLDPSAGANRPSAGGLVVWVAKSYKCQVVFDSQLVYSL